MLTLPRTFEPGTNFQDARFTVGISRDSAAVATCRTATNGERSRGTRTLGGEPFAAFTLSDAGAGNRYETTSYRTVHAGACYAVEYTIHSTNLGNYDPSQRIKAFDEAKITSLLDGTAGSFEFVR
jgi:hypothetical protein